MLFRLRRVLSWLLSIKPLGIQYLEEKAHLHPDGRRNVHPTEIRSKPNTHQLSCRPPSKPVCKMCSKKDAQRCSQGGHGQSAKAKTSLFKTGLFKVCIFVLLLFHFFVFLWLTRASTLGLIPSQWHCENTRLGTHKVDGFVAFCDPILELKGWLGFLQKQTF